MKLLAIDIGNTRIKWGVFADGALQKVGACKHADLAASPFLAVATTCQKAIIANVAQAELLAHVVDLLQKNGIKPRIATVTEQACGVLNGYKMPKTLGVDRWVAAIAAYHQTQQSALVVNAGTAITLDALVVESGVATFAGGSIMPGLTLMQKALQTQTVQLTCPLGQLQALPTQTDDAIASGLLNAAVGAIMIASQNLSLRTLSAPNILLTGGDALQLRDALEFYGVSATVVDHLVLHGLLAVLLESEAQ